jgi:hypothetical protein
MKDRLGGIYSPEPAEISDQAHRISPTAQACATQPRGVKGASPSQSSLAVPRTWVLT